MTDTLQIELPLGISAKAFADPNFTGAFAEGQLIVCYDVVSRTGGLYHVAQQLWRTWWPVDMQTFAALSQAAIEVELRHAEPARARN